MKTPGYSAADAEKASQRTLITAGIYQAVIREAVERPDRHEASMIELLVGVRDADGNERQFRDFLTGYDAGAAKLRKCCASCGPDVLARYEAGHISQDLFPGREILVRIGIQKGTRAYPNSRNVILDYVEPADSSVVTLH